MIAAKLATYEHGGNQHSEGVSIDTASKMLGVGRASAARAKTVQRDGFQMLARVAFGRALKKVNYARCLRRGCDFVPKIGTANALRSNDF
jgi:hypothetical protein